MLDLLNLPGIRPIDSRSDRNGLTIINEVVGPAPITCTSCARPLHRHGLRTVVFADTPVEMRPVRLEIARPRFRCASCGLIYMQDLPFLDERRRATIRLVNAIRSRCLAKTFRDVAQDTGLALNTVKNIALDLISELDATVHYETPVIMGIDEVNIAGGFRCVITNLATRNVYDMLPERTQAHLKPFFERLPDREKVEWVCTDMWRPFKKSFGPFFPNARLVIDKFHVVKMASEAMEFERKAYQKALEKHNRLHLKKTIRWLTLKRPSSLTPEEQHEFQEVRKVMPGLAQAYDFKEMFYAIYDEATKAGAMRAFAAWENTLPSGQLKQFHSLAKTVHNHYQDIFAYWDSPVRITNAFTESMNSVMKVANRIGRGYTFEIIRAKMRYAKYARSVGSLSAAGTSTVSVSTNGHTGPVEFGPHIPTLADMAERGEIT